MRHQILSALALSSILISEASAQVTAVAGPPAAPVGCPFTVALSNDTNAPVSFLPSCLFSVSDAGGVLVYALSNCGPNFSTLAAGATYTATWPQVNTLGVPVPPGNYTITVGLPPFPGGGVAMFPVTVGGVDAAIALSGAPRIGTARSLELCAPLDGGRNYLVAAALGTSPGIPTCAGLLPLAPDELFTLSLTSGVFQSFQGVLNNTGQSSSPVLAIPRSPALFGATFFLAFVAYDAVSSCPITRISAPLPVTIR